jgi:large conductance mechanosensitive channel
MSMRKEFQEFIAGGNVVDIAVGFVMGAIFTALITSFVDTIIMPIVAIPFGEPSFDAIIWTVNDSQILAGSFLTALVAFLLTALGLFFFFVKPINLYRQRTTKAVEEEPAGPTEVELLTQIRDSLRDR